MYNIIGVDSETIDGKPLSFQFYSEHMGISDIIFTDEKKASNDFINYLKHFPEGDYRLYGLNLQFDLIEFFYNHHKKFIMEYDFMIQNFRIKGIYGSMSYCSISNASGSKKFLMLDVNNFFKGSLKKLADIFCPNLPKLSKPFNLGSIKYTINDKKFVAYALRDAEITYHIGVFIEQIHKDYNIPYSVSVSNLAGKIFRSKYLDKPIPLAPMPVIHASMHSYHGGKNNITVDKGFYKDVIMIDINSAYPYAMLNFPSFSDIDLYKQVDYNNNHMPNKVYPEGVYKISGYAFDCIYPILYDHDFKFIKGDFSNVWVTGYELNEALQSKEVKLSACMGFFYDSENDFNISPFKEYVTEMYGLKNHYSEKKNPVMAYFYKIILNGLYGKFIQSKDYSNKFTEYDFNDSSNTLHEVKKLVAGGLFNPFIASLITGKCRAMIHNLEHKFNALHTATDGIICYKKDCKNIKPSTELGAYKIECSGDALILRNKLYCIYDKKGIPIKYGLHGFQGKVANLMTMFKENKYTYSFIKPNKLKSSLKQKKQVNLFEEKHSKLNL